MNKDKAFGKNGFKVSEVKTMHNCYGTKPLYIERGQSIIFLPPQDIVQYNQICDKELNQKQSQNKFHLRTKPPTNLTRAQKKHQQKLQKEQTGKPKTSISIDLIPSQIYDSTFQECFTCIDKNAEIRKLKQQLKIAYDENEKHKKQNQQLTQFSKKFVDLANVFMNQNIQLQKRLLTFEEQCNKLKQNQKTIAKKKEQKLPPSQYISQVVQKQKWLYERINKLEQDNIILKNSNISKDHDIKRLQQNNKEIQELQNPQANSMTKKNRYSIEKCIASQPCKNDNQSFIESQALNNDDYSLEIVEDD